MAGRLSSAALLRIAAVSDLARAPCSRVQTLACCWDARAGTPLQRRVSTRRPSSSTAPANDGYLRPQLVRDGDTATGTHVFSAVEAGFYKRTELRREREKRREREEAKERREGESLLDQKRKGLTT